MAKINSGLIALGSKLLTLILKCSKLILAGASFASYSYLIGWKFALTVMAMLFVHESGHVWAMRKSGIPTKGFYFIPFFGGAAVADREFHSRSEEFFVAIMGPIWGFLFAAVIMIGYYISHDAIFAVIASWMALINLFNLLPINPLDGGRMLKSIAFSINTKLGMLVLYIGILAFAILMIYSKVYFFGVLLIISFLELLFEKGREIQIKIIDKKHIPIYIFLYLLIAFVLYTIIFLMKDVSGADVAHKIIFGK